MKIREKVCGNCEHEFIGECRLPPFDPKSPLPVEPKQPRCLFWERGPDFSPSLKRIHGSDVIMS